MLAQAVADRRGGDRARGARRLERRCGRAPGAPRAPTSGCSRSRAPRRRDGARPGSGGCRRRRTARRSPRSRWPPVTTTTSGPSACSARASSSTSSGAAGRRRARAPRAGSGVITVARGSSVSTSARAGGVVEQHGAGLGDHHGVDHDRRAGLEQVERLVDRRDDLGRPEHPDLHGVDADVLGDGPDLLDDEVAGHRVHAGDADGVLRGQRGDRGHAVDAAAGERLQVGLDPGAAAGVRAGDREHGGDGGGPCRSG